MPSKVKVNAIASGSAGFLKPTFSSMSKGIDKNEIRPGSGPTRKKFNRGPELDKIVPVNQPDAIRAVTQESPLHSTTSPGAGCQQPYEEDKQVGSENTLVPRLNDDEDDKKSVHVSSEENKIDEARRVCDELRQQIEDLKLQQKQFVTRLGEDLEPLECGDAEVNDPPNGKKKHEKNERQRRAGNGFTAEATNAPGSVPLPGTPFAEKNTPLSWKPNSQDENESTLSEDSFTLHGSATSSEARTSSALKEWMGTKSSPKNGTPVKVIRKLYSERERYKKKVRQLQGALQRLKKQTTMTSFSQAPDIAAHDIVYFNADLIGEGFMSYVYAGTLYKNQKVAVKKLVRPDMMSTSDRSYLAAEAGLLMSLHHHNIVEIYGVSTAALQPLIISELVNGKTLHERLHSSSAWGLSHVEYYTTVRDVAIGMAYLHGQKPPVLHLNLRPCNILLEANGHAKVADFGFSKIRLDAGISNHGNLSYLAPELMQCPVHLTTKLDVYSFAVIMWEMATMHTPYKDMSTSDILDFVSSGKRLNIPGELPSGFHAILSRCWDQSPMQRPSFKELIILLETVTLPQDWIEAIEKSGISRAETKGLFTPRDMADTLALSRTRGSQQRSRPMLKQPDVVDANEQRKRLSAELALESDMMAMGYDLPTAELARGGSGKYLKGFYPDSLRAYEFGKTATGEQPSLRDRSTRHRRTPHRRIPNAEPMQRMLYSSLGRNAGTEGKEANGSFKYQAARNLNMELSGYNDTSERAPASGEVYGLPSHGIENGKHRNGHSKKISTLPGQEVAYDQRDKDGIGPRPLTGEDLRYVDQDLTVETPKIMGRRQKEDMLGVKPGLVTPPASQSQEDLRTAVSIPYLKNRKSGDESSSSASVRTQQSYFDEKLHSYVSDACEAESRNSVDARHMKGWHSSRSAILNRQLPASASDHVKVRSIGTSAADRLFERKQTKGQSPFGSVSSDTVMTALYVPTDAQRKKLEIAGRNAKSNGQKRDELISPTTEGSLDESRMIGVVSIPSNSVTNVAGPNRYRRSHSDDNSASEPRSFKLHRHFSENGYRRDHRPWDKLKNSYSPEPYAPLPVGGKPTVSPIRTHADIALPPGLGSQGGLSPFRPIAPERRPFPPDSSSKNSRKRHDTHGSGHKQRLSEIAKEHGHVASRHTDERDRLEVLGERSSEISSAGVDSVEATLADTVNELLTVSGMLETAADQRRKDIKKQKKHKRSGK